MVNDLFGRVKNNHISRVVYDDHPYGPEELKRKCYMVPIKDTRSLTINFAAPDIVRQYKTAVSEHNSDSNSTLLHIFREATSA